MEQMRKEDFYKEFKFRTSRSSGSGGQHVNKVETKVELLFDVVKSTILSDKERATIQERLSNRISKDGILMLVSQKKRSQLLNKQEVVRHFFRLIESALSPRKTRKATTPTKSMIAKRLKAKRLHGEKKASRQRVSLEDMD